MIETAQKYKWLQPAIPTENILDQSAYKPTGSTTAALVHFMHQVTKMLEQNNYYIRMSDD